MDLKLFHLSCLSSCSKANSSANVQIYILVISNYIRSLIDVSVLTCLLEISCADCSVELSTVFTKDVQIFNVTISLLIGERDLHLLTNVQLFVLLNGHQHLIFHHSQCCLTEVLFLHPERISLIQLSQQFSKWEEAKISHPNLLSFPPKSDFIVTVTIWKKMLSAFKKSNLFDPSRNVEQDGKADSVDSWFKKLF